MTRGGKGEGYDRLEGMHGAAIDIDVKLTRRGLVGSAMSEHDPA
jgi:hypothetical protein